MSDSYRFDNARTREEAAASCGSPLGHALFCAPERGNEMRALVAKRQAARFQNVTRKEKAGERKTAREILAGGRSIGFAQECRQWQHLVCPRFARGARYGASRLRRDIDEIGGGSG